MLRLASAITLLALLGVAPAVHAQSDSGAVIGGTVAATVFGSGTEPSVSGSISYRLNRVVGFGIETTWLPSLKSDPAGILESPYLAIWRRHTDGDAVFFSTNVRLEIPVQSERIIPFAIAGGGVASFTRRYDVSIAVDDPLFPTLPVPTGLIPSLVPYSSSSTSLMLTLGGGVSLLMSRHVAVDIDLRTISLHGQESGTIGRFAAGASYRF